MKAAGAVWLVRRCRALVFGILAAAALPLLAPGAASGLDVPPGYQLDVPIKGVQRPTALAFAPSTGDVFVAERNGTVRVFNGIHDPKPALSLDITEEVHSFGDRGMLGMVLDPEYPDRPYLYLSYTYDARPGGEAPTHEQRSDGSNTCKNLKTGVDEFPDDCVVTGRVSRVELNPSTGLAVENGLTPLITDWCQQYQGHSMGDLKFDNEGALLATGGDGANFAALDYGQFGNPCEDPEYEGGALRSQDIRGRWNDPTGYSGSIIRIDPDSGDPWPTNEQFESADSKVRRIIAYGLRNPFRLAIRPGTTELYIADVGSSYVDEINLIPNPAEQPNGWPSNFGWPCFEGADPHPGFQALAFSVPLEICRRLYESAPVNLKSPIFSYPRLGELFSGDECEPSSGAALAGLSFYERPATGLSGRLPEELDGALLIADAARGCVWTMGTGGDGRPDSGKLRNLITPTPGDEGVFTPVNFAVDPDGALYIPDFWGNRIVRLRHFEGNQTPVARINADRHYGDMEGGKFEVEFDGSDSTDADGESLTYEWDLDEDGEFEIGPTGTPTLPHTYEEEVNFIAQLRVTDEEGAASVDRMTLYPGNHPPEVPTMESPRAGILWTVGDKISLVGSATDPDEDKGDEVRLDWDVLIRHCPDHCHSHSLAHVSGPEPEPITAPDHEHPSHLQVTLTATDNRGMSEQTTRDIHPRTVEVTLDSTPPGVPLTIASTTRSAPFAEPLLAGGAATVSAPETAVIGGQQYTFSSWSNGGTRTHLANWPQSETLVARYAAVPSIVPLPPPPPKRVKLRFVSRPAALPLRVGRGWRRAPFHRWVARGHRPRIAAPRRVRRGGRVHVFSHWRHGGRRAQKVRAAGPRTYVAVFKSRPDRKRKR